MAPKRTKKKAKKRAAELCEEPEDDDVLVDAQLGPLWAEFRAKYPAKCEVATRERRMLRPDKDGQAPWDLYKDTEGQHVTWMAPMAIQVHDNETHSLKGLSEQMALYRYREPGSKGGRPRQMERFTNIHEIQHLANKHPAIGNVELHCANKQDDPKMFNEKGRALKYHQSPWNLRVTLAAFGASMLVGLTVNDTNKDLISIWYCPCKGSSKVLHLMHIVFCDIVRAEHVWRLALDRHPALPAPVSPPESVSGVFITNTAFAWGKPR